MQPDEAVVGVDVGSVAVTVALVDARRRVIGGGYSLHRGDAAGGLRKLLRDLDLSRVRAVAATESTPRMLRGCRRYDNRVAVIAAARNFHRRIGTVLTVGAERFGAVFFDREGNYSGFQGNTSCAAGTGSFLDQQAARLGLKGIEELCAIADENRGPVPRIASRCAVFAKTDLVHAQQEGHGLAAICDGLCYGLARNIVETLFSRQRPRAPLIFTGGVARNRAVARHIEALVGTAPRTEGTASYGAVGAALCLLEETPEVGRTNFRHPDDFLTPAATAKQYEHPPLELRRTDYPTFDDHEHWNWRSGRFPFLAPVEVEWFGGPGRGRMEVMLGVDIGSTSTKAVLTGAESRVLAGFYTRTAGRPLEAVQEVLASVEALATRQDLKLHVAGAATTGAGRKFIGRILGADLVIDEISAHARAAVELDPAVDTIIEIGGQDSKFTTLRDGRVTFAVMNTVCAAGTGSFVEEQARRLDCPLSDYARRTAGRRAPLVSDRCTVFMERDLNHYLNEGYGVDEMLAAVLHAICENYLRKVAVENRIGRTVFFQGATARNRALVAAFEQRLDRPIRVSRYCHLTGAMGAALMLADEGVRATGFRGLGLSRARVPVRAEVCDLCTNHCKLSVAEVDGETVAYGFLCGRDYHTRRFVDANRSGFDARRIRRRAFRLPTATARPRSVTVGIPAALHLVEDLARWRMFFQHLGIATITSEGCPDALKRGRQLAGADFCAPVAALHGHVDFLLEQADYVFLPACVERKSGRRGVRRQFCYYTQYADTLALTAVGDANRGRLLSPLVDYLYSRFHTRAQLYRMVRRLCGKRISFLEVTHAWERAEAFVRTGRRRLRQDWQRAVSDTGDRMRVVLLGRPYIVLPADMNKRIPEMFAALGVPTGYQDMLSIDPQPADDIRPLMDELHWHHAARVLTAARKVADDPDLYPVLMTAFKCTPDAFAGDYFQQLMERAGKPYLVLQLDEHGSGLGYETRIEAAVRAFRGHHRQDRRKAARPAVTGLTPRYRRSRPERTLLLPGWDRLTMPLIAAALQREGIDARVLEETPGGIRRAMRHNGGQCIPLNIVAQGFKEYVTNHDLDPARTALWVGEGSIACNLKLYPHHIQTLLERFGGGMERAQVYAGNLSMSDISLRMPYHVYFAYMFGGLLRRAGCRLRPYEAHTGETDRVIESCMPILAASFRGRRSRSGALRETVVRLAAIASGPCTEPRVKAAVFGDLYVRDNRVMNQDLIRFIERHGGEVITIPYSYYLKMIAKPYFRKWFNEGQYMSVLSSKAYLAAVRYHEKEYYRMFQPILKEPEPVFDQEPAKILAAYNVRIEQSGESMENLLKIHYIRQHHPDVSLFVQTSPAFCCPALVTEAMAGAIERRTGVPVLTINYDGTGGRPNEAVIPFLKLPRKRQASQSAEMCERVG